MLILLNENYLQALDKITTSNNWVTLLFLFLFVGIVLLKAINSSRLKSNVYSLFNVTFVETEIEENTGFFDVFQIVQFIFSVSVLSLIVFHFKNYILVTMEVSFSSFLAVFFKLLFFSIHKKL